MKKILHVLFLITLVSTFAVKTEGIDDNFDMIQPEDYADTKEQQAADLKRLSQEVHKSQLTSKPERTDLEVHATPKPGFFDRIRNWANKRTLSKKFTEHAKNSNTGNFDFSDATTKKMWGSLGKQDQIDLVKEWSDTRIKTIDKELNNNRKKYENAVKSYEAGNKKRILAEVDRTQKDIQELDKKIARAKAELDSTTLTETKNTLTEQISRLKELQNAQKNNEKEALESITKKMKDLKNRYNTDKDDILAKRDTNMNAFADSVNSTYEEGSLIEAKVRRKSEKTTQPTAKPTTVTVEPTTSQPEATNEPDYATLTKAEIKNLSDTELAEVLKTLRTQSAKVMKEFGPTSEQFNNVNKKLQPFIKEDQNRETKIFENEAQRLTLEQINNELTILESKPFGKKTAKYKIFEKELESRKALEPETTKYDYNKAFNDLLALHSKVEQPTNPEPNVTLSNDSFKGSPMTMTDDAIQKEIQKLTSQGEDNLSSLDFERLNALKKELNKRQRKN